MELNSFAASLALEPEEQGAFATAALALRFGERSEGQSPVPITAEQPRV